MRPSGRKLDELRNVSIETNITMHAEGSCIIKMGDTHIICTATIEDRVPPFINIIWIDLVYKISCSRFISESYFCVFKQFKNLTKFR